MWILLAFVLLAGCGAEEDKLLDGKPLNEMDVEKYVTLGDYTDLAVSVEPASAVDEDYLEQVVLSVYNGYVTAEDGITDRAVQIGDTVNIDYEGRKDGVAFAGGTAAGASLTIGSGKFIAGFEDGLVGVMPGETVDLDLTFPEGYGNADLDGQAVVFTVTVNFILPGSFAEMKDSVVPYIGIEGVNTVEELRQDAYDYLYSAAEEDYKARLMYAIIDEVIARSTFTQSVDDLIEQQKQDLTAELEYVAAANSTTADLFTYYYYGMNAEEFVSFYAETGVKQNLILQAIANRENLNVTDEEMDSLLEEYALDAGYGSVEELLGNTTKEDVRHNLMTDNVLEFLMMQNQGQ